MMSTRTRSAPAWVVALVALAAVLPSSAGAEAPDDIGWWSRAQTPTTPAGVPPPPTIPAPPPQAVPEGGLFVAMGTYSDAPDPAQPPSPVAPIAIAALRFTVPEGSEATLSLGLAEGYDADGPPQAPHPPFLVDACVPDTNAIAWDPPAGANGRWEDRPIADCDSVSAPSTVEEDGQRMSWELTSQFQVTEGVLDVILIPRGIPDPQNPAKAVGFPFGLAFSPPDEQALMTEGGVEEEAFGEGGSDDFGFAIDEGDFGGDLGFEDLSATGFGDDFGVDTGFSDDTVAGAGGRTGRRAQPVASVPAIDDRIERVMAVAVLFALIVGLWWIGSEPVRAPRLLGSVGSGASVTLTPEGASRGGVGRFSRARSGRPPRLS